MDGYNAIDLIELLMKTKGIKQSEMAVYLGVTRQTVNIRLNKKRQDDMNVETFARMLSTMGYDLVARSRDGKKEYLIGR